MIGIGTLVHLLRFSYDHFKDDSSIHTPAIDTPVSKFSENLIQLNNFKTLVKQCEEDDEFKNYKLNEDNAVRSVLTAATNSKNSLEIEISKINNVINVINDIPVAKSQPIPMARDRLFKISAEGKTENDEALHNQLPTLTGS